MHPPNIVCCINHAIALDNTIYSTEQAKLMSLVGKFKVIVCTVALEIMLSDHVCAMINNTYVMIDSIDVMVGNSQAIRDPLLVCLRCSTI